MTRFMTKAKDLIRRISLKKKKKEFGYTPFDLRYCKIHRTRYCGECPFCVDEAFEKEKYGLL